MQKIIDCRARPNTPEYYSLLGGDGIKHIYAKTGHPYPEKPHTLDDFVNAFEAEGITSAVCTGRDMETTGQWKVSNDYVADLVAAKPGKIIGLAGIDPHKGYLALQEIDRSINELHLKGISLDPALVGLYPNDPKFFPIYQKCQDMGIPVFITIGPAPVGGGLKMSYGAPGPIDDVAADFPKLKILCSHGAFPYTQEMIAIAWRNDNVYFEPSIYIFMPGAAELIVKAANTIIGDKICFASAFPFAPFSDVHRFKALGFSEEVLPLFFHDNAAKLLNL